MGQLNAGNQVSNPIPYELKNPVQVPAEQNLKTGLWKKS
jgi:hypothetical protein